MDFQPNERSAVHDIYQKILWLVAPIWIALLIELIGGWRFGMDPYSDKYAIPLGPFYPLTSLALGAAIASPLLILAGFLILLSKRKALLPRMFSIQGLVLLLTISLLAGMFSCAWSCSGHPTWIEGYK
jgi:hypothetical protein